MKCDRCHRRAVAKFDIDGISYISYVCGPCLKVVKLAAEDIGAVYNIVYYGKPQSA